MNITLLCLITVVAAILSIFLKKYNPEYSIVISIITGVLIFIAVLSHISPAISEISNLITSAKMPSEYALILFKSMGICFLTQFASDSCKDAGEVALSSKIELAGKVMIVILSLPLFKEILKTVTALIGG